VNQAKAVIRLIAGPADGLIFTVPAGEIPPFAAFGSVPLAMHEREPSDGEAICYRFTPSRKRTPPKRGQGGFQTATAQRE
jgi:hypothetical protein